MPVHGSKVYNLLAITILVLAKHLYQNESKTKLQSADLFITNRNKTAYSTFIWIKKDQTNLV